MSLSNDKLAPNLTKHKVSQVINVRIAHVAQSRHWIAIDGVEDDDDDRLQGIKNHSGILLVSFC